MNEMNWDSENMRNEENIPEQEYTGFFGDASESENVSTDAIMGDSDSPELFDLDEGFGDELFADNAPAEDAWFTDEEEAEEKAEKKSHRKQDNEKRPPMPGGLTARAGVTLAIYVVSAGILAMGIAGLVKNNAKPVVREPEPVIEEKEEPVDEQEETSEEPSATPTPAVFAVSEVEAKYVPSSEEVFAELEKSVLCVTEPEAATFEQVFLTDEAYASTGVVISADGYILTKGDALKGDSVWLEFADGTTCAATVCGTDAETGSTLIKAELAGGEFSAVSIGSSDKIVMGTKLYTAEYTTDSLYGGDVLVAAVDGDGYTVDCVLSEGTLLFDAYGRLCGMVSGELDGRSRAVTGDRLVELLNQLAVNGTVERKAIHGIGIGEVREVNKVLAERFSLPQGLYIVSMNELCSARDAGIAVHDVIVSVNGIAVYTEEQLYAVLAEYEIGDTVNILYSHGNTSTVTAAVTVINEAE